MSQHTIEMRKLPDPPEKVPIKERYYRRLETLEEELIECAGMVTRRQNMHSEKTNIDKCIGANQAFTKAAQMVREIRREFKPRVRDMMDRR